MSCLPILVFGQTTHFIEILDGKICATVYGSGDPILIINGGPGMDSSGFSSLALTLSKTHQCILFDQRGTGTACKG